MNRSLRQAVIVGILTISTVVGALAFLHSVRKGVGSGNAYKVWTLLDNADGLYRKSRVMIAGIVVGEIISINLYKNKARIDLWIKNEIRLYKDATVAKISVGFLGDQALQLSQGHKETGFIGDGGQIKVVRKVGLMASVSKTIPKVNAAIPHVIKLAKTLSDIGSGPADKGKGSLRDIAESLRVVAKALAAGVQNNQQRIEDIIRSVQQITRVVALVSTKNSGDIGAILKNLKDTTGNIKRLSSDEATIREILKNIKDLTKSFKQMAENTVPSTNRLQKVVENLEKTLSQTGKIAEKINKGKGTLGRLINDDRLVRKIEHAVVNVTGLVNKISLMKVHVRWRADYYLSRGTFRNGVALTLRPTPNKFYTLELVDDPRGVMNITRKVTRTTDPRSPAVVSSEETVIQDTFRLSLQLNYKYWMFVFRGGLIESTAGFGIDFMPWKNHIRIGAEIFNFGLENAPRLRIKAIMNLWILTLSGGVDDILNNGRRDFFFGIGLQFTDDDLKAILPFLPLR